MTAMRGRGAVIANPRAGATQPAGRRPHGYPRIMRRPRAARKRAARRCSGRSGPSAGPAVAAAARNSAVDAAGVEAAVKPAMMKAAPEAEADRDAERVAIVVGIIPAIAIVVRNIRRVILRIILSVIRTIIGVVVRRIAIGVVALRLHRRRGAGDGKSARRGDSAGDQQPAKRAMGGSAEHGVLLRLEASGLIIRTRLVYCPVTAE